MMKQMIRFAVLFSILVGGSLTKVEIATSQNQQMWVTGYYPDWANTPRPANIEWNIWTHIIHFGITPTTTFMPDPANPWQRHFTFLNGQQTFENAVGNQNYPVQRQLIDTAHAHGRKVLLGYNGAAGAYVNWINMYNQSPDSMRQFVSWSLKYAKLRGYDGVDIDWEWPGSISEGIIWNFFVKTIRDTLNTWSPRGILTAAMFQWAARLSSNIDYALMNSAIDQWNIMCYDMEYASRNVHHAPLYPTTCNLLNPGIGYGTVGDNVTELVHQYVLKGVNKSIIGVGLPFYGYQHNGSSTFCTASGGGSQIQYFNILPLYQGANASRYTFDTTTQTPYIGWTDGSGGHFISFDDSLSLAAKSSWAKSAGVGGLMVWEMDQDKYVNNRGHLANGILKGLGGAIVNPTGDSLLPVISITSPTAGASVDGALLLTVSASDNVGVSRVDYFVNGVLTGSTVSNPFSYYWTTAGLSGAQILTARAYDPSGNSKLSLPVAVTVNNAPSSPTNIAYQKGVSASTVQSSTTYYAQNAVDGNASTRWASAYADPQWIRVDLGSVHRIDSVMISWEGAYATSYDIQTSNDSVNWTSVYWTTGGNGGVTRLKLKPVDTRYVRMFGRSRATSFGYSTYEFQVFSPSGVSGVGGPGNGIPEFYSLQDNYPNPFNPATRISYGLPVESEISLTVYNILGEAVKILETGPKSAGTWTSDWNATDNHGNAVPSGLYFYRLRAVGTSDPSTSFTKIKKMMLLK